MALQDFHKKRLSRIETAFFLVIECLEVEVQDNRTACIVSVDAEAA